MATKKARKQNWRPLRQNSPRPSVPKDYRPNLKLEQHWLNYDWKDTPFKCSPFADDWLRVWLYAEDTGDRKGIPEEQHRQFFDWLKWKENPSHLLPPGAPIDPEKERHWQTYNWNGTPVQRAPWSKRWLRVWLFAEERNLPGLLPKTERHNYFRWYRWKNGLPDEPVPGPSRTVFFHDEKQRLRRYII